ncbi:hypothetical protein V2A60_008685 [Cordyceps javanica]
MAGVLRLVPRLNGMVHPATWLETNSILDALAPPRYVAEAVVKCVSDASAPAGHGPSVAVAFSCLDGANLDFDEEAMAYSRKGASWMLEVLGQWDVAEKNGEYMGWVDGVVEAMSAHSLRNGYVKLLTCCGARWLSYVYGSSAKWERLCALKNELDPGICCATRTRGERSWH